MQGLVDWVATSWEQIKKAQSSKVAGLLYAIPEHPKRPIDHLSRCGPWRVIPGSEALRGARRDVPGRMTFHDVGLHQYTGREIEGLENYDRSP
jgi:hypothetical protein